MQPPRSIGTDGLAEGPAVTSRSCDRDVITGPARAGWDQKLPPVPRKGDRTTSMDLHEDLLWIGHCVQPQRHIRSVQLLQHSGEDFMKSRLHYVCTADALRNSGSDGIGQVSLEFYQKKKSRWPFSDECIPWEVWTIKINIVSLATEQERQICREKVGEKLGEKIINIVEVMNRHEYLPKMPTQSEVDNVFDTSLKDVQPYLYKISFQITDSLGTSVTTTMRRLIKDTLAL
ncbi:unnamed protein product [Ranitomeya imitator]|uniref:Autophagy-related protein 101 n=1 Tax=Ranitomeya imitator TaxID=111125 RepID=A0ABN9LJ84_9NEOB|nr:unnamed protein product [Ranitomeya imitator]